MLGKLRNWLFGYTETTCISCNKKILYKSNNNNTQICCSETCALIYLNKNKKI